MSAREIDSGAGCPQIGRRALLLSLAALPLAAPLSAAPVRYRLDQSASSVGFFFTLSGSAQKGTMPIRSADIVIDTANLTRSRADVTLDVARARTNLVFARTAMLGPDVLDARRFPTIRFTSTRVQLGPGGRLSDGARITGDLTVRDVTRPVVLEASLFRRRGSAADDLSELSFRLRGAISRRAFGASGYRDLVRDAVTLDIRAVIRQA
ncbi:MAG: YceI family protein [Ruegeria sp.]|uniref:YceI family protein n=1 Tax=Ruegeria sp. TaxID=1879320 RepID=UPI00349ECE2F